MMKQLGKPSEQHLQLCKSYMNDTEKIPLSYLSQYYFCKRRAGLILLEQAWEDNVYTVEGSLQHERVHTKRIEKRGNFVKLYELSVFSELHCLSGKCDCVEAHECEEGVVIPALQQTYSYIRLNINMEGFAMK